jgi:hypothetical protein
MYYIPDTEAFWDIAACSLVEADRRFKDPYCIHHYGISTRCNIPEGCHLRTRRRETLQSRLFHSLLFLDITSNWQLLHNWYESSAMSGTKSHLLTGPKCSALRNNNATFAVDILAKQKIARWAGVT